MKDRMNKPTEGYLTIQSIDLEGKVIDTFESKNMIMSTSKTTLAQQVSGNKIGSCTDSVIGSFTLGTQGHIAGDITNPKIIDYNKTELYSQAENLDNFWMVDFDVVTTDNTLIVPTNAGMFGDNPTSGEDCDVRVNLSASEIEYTFDIPASSATNGSAIIFTEASLCVNTNKDFSNSKSGDIFSMRTFNGRLKDDTVAFKITWKIIF